MKTGSIAILVPAYNRAKYLPALLDSVLSQSVLPSELVIREDNSPERTRIQAIVSEYLGSGRTRALTIKYIENEQNLGYDGNLRRLLLDTTCDYSLFLGNDDTLCVNAVKNVQQCIVNTGAYFISRSLTQLDDRLESAVSVSKVDFSRKGVKDGVVICDAGFVFGLSSVISGLVFHTTSAVSVGTNIYDGGLYYQYHLALACNRLGGTAYITVPVVSCRAELAPDFGAAQAEAAFTPGRYTAEARIRMANAVLKVAADHKYMNWLSDVRAEVNLNQSVHICEMMAGCSRAENLRLLSGLWKLGLFRSAVPVFFILVNLLCGRHSKYYFPRVKYVIRQLAVALGQREYLRKS